MKRKNEIKRAGERKMNKTLKGLKNLNINQNNTKNASASYKHVADEKKFLK